MSIEYFCAYHDYREKLAGLSDEEVGRVFRAALLYAKTGETPEMNPLESLAFTFIRCDIDRCHLEYEQKCERNRANAANRKRSQATADDGSQEKEEEKQKEEEKKEEKEKEEEEEKEEEKEKTMKEYADAVPQSARTPQNPSLEEIENYIFETGSTVSPEAFYDFYEANGWTQGRGKPIRDWKAAVRTWERRDREIGPPGITNRSTGNNRNNKKTTNDKGSGWNYIAAVAKGEIL